MTAKRTGSNQTTLISLSAGGREEKGKLPEAHFRQITLTGLTCQAGEEIDLRLFGHIVAIGLYTRRPVNALYNCQRTQ
jgi:hypothetical protein